MKRIILFLSCCLNISIIIAGFPSNVLVNTPYGHVPIQDLKVGDKVVCFKKGDKNEDVVTHKTITAVHRRKVDDLFKVTTHDGNVMQCCKDAQFYLPKTQEWQIVHKLTNKNWLLRQDACAVKIKGVEQLSKPTDIFGITVDECSNFYVSEDGILVHNEPVTITVVAIAFGEGISIVWFEGAAVAAGSAFFAYLVHSILKQVTGVEVQPGTQNGSVMTQEQLQNFARLTYDSSDPIHGSSMYAAQFRAVSGTTSGNNLLRIHPDFNKQFLGLQEKPNLEGLQQIASNMKGLCAQPTLPPLNNDTITAPLSYLQDPTKIATSTSGLHEAQAKIGGLQFNSLGNTNNNLNDTQTRRINNLLGHVVGANKAKEDVQGFVKSDKFLLNSKDVITKVGDDAAKLGSLLAPVTGAVKMVAQTPVVNGAKTVISSGLQFTIPTTVGGKVLGAQKVGAGLSSLVSVPVQVTGGSGAATGGLAVVKAPVAVYGAKVVAVVTSPAFLIPVAVVVTCYAGWKYAEYKENQIIPALLKVYDDKGTCLEDADRETLEKILAESKIDVSKEQRRLIEAQYGFLVVKNRLGCLKKPDFDSRRFIISLDEQAQTKKSVYLTQKHGDGANGFKPTLLKDTLNDGQTVDDALEQREQKKPKQAEVKATPSKTGNDGPCPCGHACGTPGCNCGCFCGCGKKEWKKNKITKQEFFRLKEISENYEHVRDGVYQLKKGGKPIAKDAYYLQWDHLHGDVEVYSKSRTHIGSLEPQALELYKDPVIGRPFPLQ